MKRNYIGLGFMTLGTLAGVFNTYTAIRHETTGRALFWGFLCVLTAWGTYVETKEGGFIKPWN